MYDDAPSTEFIPREVGFAYRVAVLREPPKASAPTNFTRRSSIHNDGDEEKGRSSAFIPFNKITIEAVGVTAAEVRPLARKYVDWASAALCPLNHLTKDAVIFSDSVGSRGEHRDDINIPCHRLADIHNAALSFDGAKTLINGRDLDGWNYIEPCALGGFSKLVLPDHGIGCSSGVFDSLERSVQSLLNKPHANDGNHEREQGYYSTRQSRRSSTLLGAQILLAACLLLAGFYALIDAFENSRTLSPSAGALRVGLSALAIGCGGLLAAFAFAPI